MPIHQEGDEGTPQKPSKKIDTSLVPKVWDLFQDGLPRGVPGADSDFDDHMHKPPWKE